MNKPYPRPVMYVESILRREEKRRSDYFQCRHYCLDTIKPNPWYLIREKYWIDEIMKWSLSVGIIDKPMVVLKGLDLGSLNIFVVYYQGRIPPLVETGKIPDLKANTRYNIRSYDKTLDFLQNKPPRTIISKKDTVYVKQYIQTYLNI